MELPSSPDWIITCEHAGNEIPKPYLPCFRDADEILNSHRGWDAGALYLANLISNKTGAQLYSYPFTRLLIDPNRSAGNPKLFSEFSRQLPEENKKRIIEEYYLPYRNNVTGSITEFTEQNGTVIHIGVHSFTPVLNGKKRDFEIGFLYDPSRILEKNVSRLWRSIINRTYSDFRVRMNQPYKGVSDGFTTTLRKTHNPKSYLGIELEFNQKLVFKNGEEWPQICSKIADTFLQLQEHLK